MAHTHQIQYAQNSVYINLNLNDNIHETNVTRSVTTQRHFIGCLLFHFIERRRRRQTVTNVTNDAYTLLRI